MHPRCHLHGTRDHATAPRRTRCHPHSPEDQQTDQWQQGYGHRAGIEGTISQGVRAFGLRRSRYRGHSKTHLQHLLTAAGMSLRQLEFAGRRPGMTDARGTRAGRGREPTQKIIHQRLISRFVRTSRTRRRRVARAGSVRSLVRIRSTAAHQQSRQTLKSVRRIPGGGSRGAYSAACSAAVGPRFAVRRRCRTHEWASAEPGSRLALWFRLSAQP
ncbi:transposase [Streptomyces olivaceus]|uniref:transposase n=1 Tax=Streptomyces olivaceus TaxID=47716 RepID=UPI0036DFE3C9